MRYVYYGRLTLYNMKVDHFMYTLSFQFNTNYLSKKNRLKEQNRYTEKKQVGDRPAA
jgi:hypothetical protein